MRAYCHLCDEMLAQVRALGIEPVQIDVDADPELEARWDEQVPVLLYGNELIGFHRLDDAAKAALSAKLEG